MSYPLITIPAGVSWDYNVSPKFSTIMQTPQSGRHPATATLQDSTIFDIELTFDYLTETSYQYLKSFYEAMRGSYGWFLFDPSQLNLATTALTNDLTQLNNGFSGVVPAMNYLTYSTDMTQLPWNKAFSGTTGPTYQNPATGPNGIPNSAQFWSWPAVPNTGGDYSALVQSVTTGLPTVLGNTFTFSVWLYTSPSAATFDVKISNAGNTEGNTTVVTMTPGVWTQVSVSHTFTGSTTGLEVWILYPNNSPAINFIGIYNPQLEAGGMVGPACLTTTTPTLGQTVFPLWRSSAVFNAETVTLLERIQNVTSFVSLYLNGSVVSGSLYTQTNFPAEATFHFPPSAGLNLSWSGNYCYLVHFSDDTADFNEFMYQLYKLKTLKMETVNL